MSHRERLSHRRESLVRQAVRQALIDLKRKRSITLRDYLRGKRSA